MDFVSLEPLPGGWSGETFVAHVAGGERQVVRIYARDPGRAEVDAALLRLVRGLPSKRCSAEESVRCWRP
jgi:hypothetical protein